MLGELQKQLQERFVGLAALRRALGYPVYALEHGVDALTLQNARAAARIHLKTRPPAQEHWLVWVVLAAEAGYVYSGDEFWPLLETEPGQWATNDRRNTLRDFYERFRVQYGGPTLVGRWARQFGIISRPVANAILPLYLQRTFVRHLYELRYGLAQRLAGNASDIGQFLLSAYQFGPSHRFREFLEQTELTTQIVFALRVEHRDDIVSRIEPNTLSRIVGDLERHQLERSYLRDTRQIFSSTAVRFAANLRGPAAGGALAENVVGQVQSRTLLLARRQSDGSFALGFRLPDVKAILDKGGVERGDLANARIRYAGQANRPEPALSLLRQSARDRPLAAFPAAHVPLFVVDNAPPSIQSLLDPVARLDERRVWLLRRQSDGAYREMLNSQVRPGQEYLLLSRTAYGPAAIQNTGLSAVALVPTEVFAYKLKTPLHLAAGQDVALGALGLASSAGISIEAAGLSPSPGRSGDAMPTWTTTETVALRVRSDRQATNFRAVLDGASTESFTTGDGTTILELGHLQPGVHNLSIVLTSQDGKPATSEPFQFEVVSPTPWPTAMREKSGFRLELQPQDASLEQLAHGEIALNLIGPVGRTVRWSFEFYDGAGHVISAVKIGETKVGGQTTALATSISSVLQNEADSVQDAPRIDIVASLEELGRQAHSFSHPVNPLRWKFDRTKGMVKLVDETDHSAAVTVRVYPYSTPVLRKEVDAHAALQGLLIEPPGVLFEATSGSEHALLYASLPRSSVIHDLSNLSESQALAITGNRAAVLVKLIVALQRWKACAPAGKWGSLEKRSTLRWIEHQIEIVACGDDFSAALRSSKSDRLMRVQKMVGGSPGFGLRMRQFEEQKFLNAVNLLLKSAVTYDIDGAIEWSAAAYTLAAKPTKLRVPDGTDARSYFEELLTKRSLLRGAFLACTASQSVDRDLIKEVG